MSRQSCGGEQVAAAQHGAAAGVLFDLAQEFPAAGPDVALLDRAAVDGDGGHAAREGAVEDREELVPALLAVIESAAHLDRHGLFGRHRVADAR